MKDRASPPDRKYKEERDLIEVRIPKRGIVRVRTWSGSAGWTAG